MHRLLVVVLVACGTTAPKGPQAVEDAALALDARGKDAPDPCEHANWAYEALTVLDNSGSAQVAAAADTDPRLGPLRDTPMYARWRPAAGVEPRDPAAVSAFVAAHADWTNGLKGRGQLLFTDATHAMYAQEGAEVVVPATFAFGPGDAVRVELTDQAFDGHVGRNNKGLWLDLGAFGVFTLAPALCG